MNAVMYVILHQYKNKIRQIYSKPLSAIFTTIACLFMVISPVIFFLVPQKGIFSSGMLEVTVACVQLFIGLILVNTFLSQQSGLFMPSDANLLFTSPLTSSGKKSPTSKLPCSRGEGVGGG
jgi:hypothetical protein